MTHPSREFPVDTAGRYSSCEHYVNTVGKLTSALSYQNRINPFHTLDITFDFEDGATGESFEAVANAITSPLNKRKRVGIRIPNEHENWGLVLSEMIRLTKTQIAYVAIPKAENADHIKMVDNYIRGLNQAHGQRFKYTPIHAIIETGYGLENASEIADLYCVRSLGFGILDYVADFDGAIPMRYSRSPGQWEHEVINAAKVKIVQAAAASCIPAVHNPTLEIDSDLIYNDALAARERYGFTSQYSIHLDQIKPIRQAMYEFNTHRMVDVRDAGKVLLLGYENDWKPTRVDGILQGRPSYRHYWKILKSAYEHGIPIDKEAERTFFNTGPKEGE